MIFFSIYCHKTANTTHIIDDNKQLKTIFKNI